MVIAYRFVLYLVINCVGTFAHSMLSSVFEIFLHSIDFVFLIVFISNFPKSIIVYWFLFWNFVRKFPKSFDVFIIIMFGGNFLQFKYWFLVGYHFLDKFSDYGFLFSFFYHFGDIAYTLLGYHLFGKKFPSLSAWLSSLWGNFLKTFKQNFFTFLITKHVHIWRFFFNLLYLMLS